MKLLSDEQEGRNSNSKILLVTELKMYFDLCNVYNHTDDVHFTHTHTL